MTSRPALMAALVLTTNLPALTQTSAAQSEEQAILSDDWLQRRTAFILLIGANPADYNSGAIPNVGEFVRNGLAPLSGASADRRKRLLIELLGLENQTVKAKEVLRKRLGLPELPPSDRLREDYLNYYADVIAAIAGLSDIRSIEVLIGAITTGEMARGTLISFGQAAVAPVAARVSDSSDQVRSSAALTLAEMLIRSDAIAKDVTTRRVIRESLQVAARDNSYLVRARAVEGLVQLADADSIAIVKELARSDPYTYPPEYTARAGRYPVREAAAAVLKSKGIK